MQNVRAMLLDCESGKFVAEGGTKSDVLAKIRDLVGLTFEQFQRTMMLAQGKFDQFLAAAESERAEILQQATGTQIYERIGRRIFERRREAEEALKTLETKIGEIRIFPDDALAAKKAEKAAAAEKAAKIAKSLDAAQKKFAMVSKAREDFAAAENALRRREKGYAVALADVERTEKAANDAAGRFAAADALLREQRPRIKDAIALKEKIALAQKDVAAKCALLENIRASEKAERTAEADGVARMERGKIILATISCALDRRELIRPKDAKAAREPSVKLAADFVRLSAENETYEKKAVELQAEAESQAAQCEAAEGLWKARRPALENSLANARRALELSIAYASLDDWRKRLADGQPCPLCGSRHHPFAENLGVPEKSECERAVADAADALAECDASRDGARHRRDAARAALDNFAKAGADARRKFADATRRLCEARSAVAASVSAGAEAIAKTRERIAKLSAEGADADEELDVFAAVVARLKGEYDALEVGATPEKALAKLQDSFDAATAKLAGAKAAAAVATANLASAKKELESAAKLKAKCDAALNVAVSECQDCEALSAEIARLKDEKTALDALKGAIDAELRHDADARSRMDEYHRMLADAKGEALRWTNLDKWLGGSRGEQFKRFAHGMTLRRLISFANPHLAQMTAGRYQMEWNPESSHGCAKLLPSLIDNDQGGVKRPVSNLSGGERFQVSLALALGLSEMSSARLDVDSLFLDEGFGTLDGNTLEAALDTLCAVQQDGKLIGVISHVAGVADRLTTQIRVVKAGNGRSTLSGPGVRESAVSG